MWSCYNIPSNLQYKVHLIRQWNCWSLRCGWSIAYRRCFNYIFILDLTPGFNGLGKENCKTRRETFTVLGFGASYMRGLTVVYFLKIPHDKHHIAITRYGLSLSCSALITPVLYVISFYIELCYNGPGVYHISITTSCGAKRMSPVLIGVLSWHQRLIFYT